MGLHHHHARAPVAERQEDDNNADYVQTVVNIVYVTADPSASSWPESSTAAAHRVGGHPMANTRSSIAAAVTPTYAIPSRQQRPTSAAAISSANTVVNAAVASSVGGPLAQSSLFVASSATAAYSLTAPLATSRANVDKTTSDSGMSGGAKAGLAIGILLALGLLAGLLFFCYRRKKQQVDEHQRLDDEKSEMHKRTQSVASHVSVRRSKTDAPRLSLRPVTQMFPPMSEKPDASSMIANSAAAAHSRTPEPATAAPMTSTSDSSNPFDDQDQDNNMIATPAVAATPKDLSAENSSPTQAQPFPTAVVGSRRNSPPGPGPNNVHRVQLDFKPSMDDELELRAGSLVRLLHEYDDGWALCIRLDRSQQGVVPRTCVSKLPVKPRPGPPPGAMRGPPPQGRARGGPNAPGPRMNPNGPPRPMSPAMAGRTRAQTSGSMQAQGPLQPRSRANSDAMSARRVTPPSMSPLSTPGNSSPQAVPARKPVPGQAM